MEVKLTVAKTQKVLSVNPDHVLSVSKDVHDGYSVVKLVNGSRLVVVGDPEDVNSLLDGE